MAALSFGGSAQAATLNQTNVSLSQGQSSIVYASNVSTFLYLSNNSNSNVATVSISGNIISIYANSTGSTTATICENNVNNCNNIYITVNGNNNGNSGTLSLSQTNLSLSIGQTSNITIYNNYNYGTLYISNNSNSNVATASASGNSVSIYANSTGNTNITICQNGNMSSCSTVYVNVIGGYGYNSVSTLANTLGLNISNLNLSVGDSMTVSSANSNLGGLYISNNSNPGVVLTSNSSLTPGCYGNSQYSILTGQPCYGGMGYNYNYNGGSGYSSIPGCYGDSRYSILTGQSCYGGGYGSTNNTSLVISAVSVGSDMLTLCQNSGNICSSLYISVVR